MTKNHYFYTKKTPILTKFFKNNTFNHKFIQTLFSQLAQAGSSDLKEANGDVCFGISDFSDDAEANSYKEGVGVWYGDALKIGKQGRMVAGVFEYKTRHKNVYGGLKNILKAPIVNNYLSN